MEEQQNTTRAKLRQIKNMILRVELIIGFFAIVAGIIVTVMVWSEGYFAGALMMVLTGILNIYLAFKELVAPTDHLLHWQAVFFMIVRRAMFFLNIALLALVLGTFTNLI
ncbi:hypothetical protein SAMN05720781_0762 [Fibrobacter sp. UWT3]|uniref:hypothetical protein n=1 Tax=Fibrobacter sp. UWT3 TaxID=1896225 RepID=UPI000BD2879C|nr:hypothetical protein [Fibrobacter sp. UWT3]SOE54460.1 hypothetical protein SAMN05720781_0762 [Fibrobacter sp. UWT3]